MLGDNNLANYYRLNSLLQYYHKINMSEVEAMMPFEREIYVSFIEIYLQQEKDKALQT